MSPDRATVAIVTDSVSDIPAEIASALSITVIPALLTIEGQTYLDGIDISREEYYRRLPYMKEPPTTAIPSPVAFHEVFQRLLQAGYDKVISVHISEKLSGMFSVASQAAQAFGGRVQIFDSMQVSLGLGFQVMEAAVAALDGLSFEAILETLRKAREKVHVIAMIDTQEYLRRSGRVGWLTANMGNLLRLRLLVEVIDGVVERRGLIRTRKKAIEELLQLTKPWGPLKRLAMLHTAASEEATRLAERIRYTSVISPLVVDVTTLLGAHIGPASIGIVGLRQ